MLPLPSVLSLAMHLNRRLRGLLILLGLYLSLCLVGGIKLADITLHPVRRPLSAGEAVAFQDATRARASEIADVSIKGADGAMLQGWIIRPHQANGDAVLLLHGLADNRLGMIGYAELLLAHGYTVLLPDARAHGASGGELATFGLLERNDIHRWLDFLAAKLRPHCIYGMGESMGAAELLQSLEDGAQFCAVIAESCFSNFREIAYDRMGQPFHLGAWVGRTILRPVVEVAFLRARWKYHLNMEDVSPEVDVSRTQVPILLIHGQIDSNIPVRHSERIHARNPNTVLWEVPQADHCGAIAVARQEFESRVFQWLAPNAARTGQIARHQTVGGSK